MSRPWAILGSSQLANVFFGVAAYYTMAAYYGWNAPAAMPASGGGPVAATSAGHPFIVVCLLVVAALVCSVPGWLTIYRTQYRRTPPSLGSASPQVVAIQSPGGKVPQWKVISGIIHPQARLIQIFVGAGPINDKWWYRQSDRATVDGFIWTCRCKFGDNRSETGWQFDLCAIVPTTLVVESRVRELPSDAIKSDIVTVSLDRSLRDDS